MCFEISIKINSVEIFVCMPAFVIMCSKSHWVRMTAKRRRIRREKNQLCSTMESKRNRKEIYDFRVDTLYAIIFERSYVLRFVSEIIGNLKLKICVRSPNVNSIWTANLLKLTQLCKEAATNSGINFVVHTTNLKFNLKNKFLKKIANFFPCV